MASPCTRPELPLEIYTYIFSFFGPHRKSGLYTLLSLLSTSQYIRAAASASILWKPFYQARYTHAVPEKEEYRKAQYGEDYRLLYFARRELDYRALRLLDEIRTEIPGRNAKACILVKEFSFDVWDALRVETQLSLPAYFRRGSSKEKHSPHPHALPRRYWARVAQGVIARYWAVKMWQRAASGDWSVSFEEMLAGFSAFFDWSPMEISEKLDEVAEDCRDALEEAEVQLDHEKPDFNLRAVCTAIVRYMEEEGWLANDFDPDLDEHLLNSFPHTLLTAAPQSFPLSVLSKTWLFVGICRRLKIDAYATRLLPNDTVCCVRSPKSQEPLIVSFVNETPSYNPGSEVPFFKRMVEAGFPAEMVSSAFVPLPAFVFLVEAVHNVGHDLRRYHDNEIGPWDNDDEERELLAAHAMQCAVAVTHNFQDGSPMIFPERMAEILPLDGQPIFLDALFGHDTALKPQHTDFVAELKDILRRMEDVDARAVRRENYPDQTIRHFAGQIVYNAPLDEYGCVIDWQYAPDRSSSEDDEESRQDPIRYRVLSMDLVEFVREPTDYETGGLTNQAARDLYHSWKHFGRYFEDISTEDSDMIEKDGKKLPTKLVLTAEMRALYPDDIDCRSPRPIPKDEPEKEES
ncbi:hypothetical protein OH77DRAFT_1516384 [Trametes cingulata]|nr:hypothetical protein OH77DRAFT_1516384 [Trametes cingulata]